MRTMRSSVGFAEQRPSALLRQIWQETEHARRQLRDSKSSPPTSMISERDFAEFGHELASAVALFRLQKISVRAAHGGPNMWPIARHRNGAAGNLQPHAAVL